MRPPAPPRRCSRAPCSAPTAGSPSRRWWISAADRRATSRTVRCVASRSNSASKSRTRGRRTRGRSRGSESAAATEIRRGIMRFALCAALLTIASVPGALAAAGGSQLLLGNIHYGYEPPAIAGPHRLVMVAGMGNDHMRVDTSSAEAQRWFDYALTLSRAFEHADAKLAFRKAAALDPACSLCIWGEAYSRGPTINYLVDRADSAAALKLALEARRVAGPHLAAEERRLESAMIDRYRRPGDNGNGDLRYARDLDAMLHDDPDNLELEIFDAEAWLVMEFHNDRSGLAPAVSRLTP